jgi:hypothetical protein
MANTQKQPKAAQQPADLTPFYQNIHKIYQWQDAPFYRLTTPSGEIKTISNIDFLHLPTTQPTGGNTNFSHPSDDTIDVLLSLLSQTKSPPNVLFLMTFHAQVLCNIGCGKTDKSTLDVRHGPEFISPLADEAKRFIVFAVNDGMSKYTKDYKADTKNVRGKHWGLLVIDKESSTARWIDSAISIAPGQDGGEDVITKMHDAGDAAGKVLCGFDQILNLPPGGFDARTLKYVPQQSGSDNATENDKGGCGPYLYAMLEYLYDHPEAMKDLGGWFSKDKRKERSMEFGFDSLETRRAMQKWVEELEKKDHKAGERPFHLDDEVMGLLGLKEEDCTKDGVLEKLNAFWGVHRKHWTGYEAWRDSQTGSKAQNGDGGGSHAEDDELMRGWLEYSKVDSNMTYDEYLVHTALEESMKGKKRKAPSPADSPNKTIKTNAGTKVPTTTKPKATSVLPATGLFIDCTPAEIDLWRKRDDSLDSEWQSAAAQLQQMYGTRFEDMKDEEIKHWKAKDENNFPDHKKEMEEDAARDILESRYGDVRAATGVTSRYPTLREYNAVMNPGVDVGPSSPVQEVASSPGEESLAHPLDDLEEEIKKLVKEKMEKDPDYKDFHDDHEGARDLYLALNDTDPLVQQYKLKKFLPEGLFIDLCKGGEKEELLKQMLALWLRKSPQHESRNPMVNAARLQQMYGTRFDAMSKEQLLHWRDYDYHLFPPPTKRFWSEDKVKKELVSKYRNVAPVAGTENFPDKKEYLALVKKIQSESDENLAVSDEEGDAEPDDLQTLDDDDDA